MKKAFLFILFSFIFHYINFAQSSKKSKEKSIFTATTLNYYPAIESYSFFRSLQADQDAIILNFLTSNSGTFVLENNPPEEIENENINTFPSQLLNIGASVQIRNGNALFHEISLTRFSNFKSAYLNKYFFKDSLGNTRTLQVGYEQKTTVMSFRYEYGKYFGNPKSSVRFGLSGAVEPTFYFYKRDVFSVQEFPIDATIISLNVALIPMLSAKLSKKLSLDFKLIPNVLVGDYAKVKVNNPSLSSNQQEGVRVYNLPEISIAGTIQLRYLLKEPKKRRRKSNNG